MEPSILAIVIIERRLRIRILLFGVWNLKMTIYTYSRIIWIWSHCCTKWIQGLLWIQNWKRSAKDKSETAGWFMDIFDVNVYWIWETAVSILRLGLDDINYVAATRRALEFWNGLERIINGIEVLKTGSKRRSCVTGKTRAGILKAKQMFKLSWLFDVCP